MRMENINPWESVSKFTNSKFWYFSRRKKNIKIWADTLRQLLDIDKDWIKSNFTELLATAEGGK